MAIALGGCLKAQPSYGITEDTGGHITYILGAMEALARSNDVSKAEIVTRLIDDPSLGAEYSKPAEQILPNLVITRIDSGNRDYLAKEALALDRAAFTEALIKELRQRDSLPDVIHAHFADAAEVAAAVRKSLGIPFIYTAHSLGADKARAMSESASHSASGLGSRIEEERQAIEQADAIIGSSRDECERQLPAYDAAAISKIYRVRPGISHAKASSVDVDNARQLLAPFLRNPQKPMILAIARAVKKKNLVGLLKAYADSPQLQARANLVILPGIRRSVGEGTSEQVEVMRELIDMIDRNDLHGLVAYPRSHGQSHVRGLYSLACQSMGVFVNPAFIEPFGLTILEAAVHGLPVVATCEGGPVDILEELQHGVLADPSNTNEIAAAIGSVLSDRVKWTEYSSNASANIADVRWSKFAEGFIRVASQVCERRKAPAIVAHHKRLVVCDIDNTLTGCREAAADFTQFMRSRGDFKFAVATGRSLPEARRIIYEWHLPEPDVWMTSVGSEIFWAQRGGLAMDEQYPKLISASWQRERISCLCSDLPGLTAQAKIEQRDFKLSYRGDRTAFRDMRQLLKQEQIDAHTVISHGNLIDALPGKAGKGAATRHVGRILGIGPCDVITAGDSGNDIDLITSSKNAIIVANCQPELRSAAELPHVHLAKQPFAAGVLEGLRLFMRDRSPSLDISHLGEAA